VPSTLRVEKGFFHDHAKRESGRKLGVFGALSCFNTQPQLRQTARLWEGSSHAASSHARRRAGYRHTHPTSTLPSRYDAAHHKLSNLAPLQMKVGDALQSIDHDKDGEPFSAPAPWQTRKHGPTQRFQTIPNGAAMSRAGRDALCASLESFVPARTADPTLTPFSSADASDSCDATEHHPSSKVALAK